MRFTPVAKNLLRAAAIVAVASTTGACSTIPGWMNPFGDDDKTASMDDTSVSPDQAPDANGVTPDLAEVPDRPTSATPSDSQRQVAQSLAADRSSAQYSSETLRGDAETAAPPPAPPSTIDTTMPDTTTASTDTSSAADTSSESPPASQPATADATPPPPAPVAADVAPPPPTRMAAAAPPPGDRLPAVPPGPVAGVPAARGAVMTDSQLGFQRSSAPPLDASVAQFVAPSILDRYRQTAGGGVAVASTAMPSSSRSRRSRGTAMGGPEEMTGSVVANLDSLSSTPASTSAVYTGTVGTPSAVVFFPGDTTVLSGAARIQIRAAAESFRLGGNAGFIKVVGHSSSRTGNMPLERHLVIIFEKSQQRANSVAQELIRDGVPANKVLVEAVGDSQPVYYESMPKGEDGNRRAEIFLQS
jgi:outer membrane protein OmpA-like peptidoglycan-associated protein